ncbi:MAG: metal ABC transporter substrate-binding protein [Synechococcus sp.]|nr:metal ABC transporter substrate-binding protein [Synechococcus sp.]
MAAGRCSRGSLISLLLFAAVTLSGCRSGEKTSRVDDQRPQVLTTFTVLADLARNVAGDRLLVRSIVKPGAEIHGYQPTPSDIERASTADLIVENGLGLELWAERFTAAAGDVPTVTLSEGMQPLLIEEDVYAGKPNPHAWMSPKRTMRYVDRLVEAFSRLDPAGTDAFSANGAAYKQQLAQLDRDLRAALETIPIERRLLVSCEGAFSYLAQDYGLEEAYLWPVNAESQVTPKRMARLIATVRDRGVPAVFCESTVSDKAQRDVASAAGARFGGTFYVDSLSEQDGPAATLLDLQRHNVNLIRIGLQEQQPPMEQQPPTNQQP